MKIKLIFDNVNYLTKPKTDIGSIINRMTLETMKEYSIEEIKQNILDGKTNRPAYCGGKENSWISQQVFMIDIDDNYTIEQAINKCKEINIIPNFMYTSFSHTEEHHKFRLVFILDKEITDFDIAKRIQLYLMDSIGNVDIVCKNLNRPYFAGKSIVFDSGNVLNSNCMINLSKDYIVNDNNDNKINKKKIKTNHNDISDGGGKRVTNILLNNRSNSINSLVTVNPQSSKSESTDQYNLKAIRNRDEEYLKNRLNYELIEFENKDDFWYHLYHNIDMGELLEFKYPSSIRCLFHDDNNPSASIFQTNEGKWLYKCHSNSCGLIMNVKQLIEKLAGFKSEHKAIEFMKTIFNLSIKETNWTREQKANLDLIINKLNINQFAELCPQTDKNIRYVKELFLTMIGIAQNNIYGENYMSSDGDAVFFVSLKDLAKITKTAERNINRISQRIAVLVYHDLIRKLDDDKIPEKMLARARAISIANNTVNRVNFYSIPSWVIDQLMTIENQGIKWKQNGYTIKGTSYEMFYRTEGLEVAQKIYPQHKKVKTEIIDYETGEIITTIKDRTTSKTSDDRVNKIAQSIHNLINKKSYTTEKELIIYLSNVYRWEVTEIQLRKMRGELSKLGYKRIRANKEIKELYKMDTLGYPFIIVKND